MEKWKFQRNAVYLFGTKQKRSEREGVAVVLERGPWTDGAPTCLNNGERSPQEGGGQPFLGWLTGGL